MFLHIWDLLLHKLVLTNKQFFFFVALGNVGLTSYLCFCCLIVWVDLDNT